MHRTKIVTSFLKNSEKILLLKRSEKVKTMKRVFINVLYKIGMPVKSIKKVVGLSRATVYRHINR